MTRSVLILATTFLLGIAVPRAEAQGNAKQRATKLVREAAQLYQDGDRIAAVRKFEEAYKIYPSAAILYNLGTAYRGVGRNAMAHRTLSKFLRTAKKLPGKRRAQVQQTLQNIETVVGRLTISVASPGLRVLVDGDFVGMSPLPGPVAVPPGVHLVSLEKDGRELAQKQIAAGTGAQVEVKFFAIATSTKLPTTDTKPDPATKIPSPKDAAKTATDPDPSITTPPRERESKSILAKWWFWTAVGAVVLTGTAIALSGSGSTVNDVNPTLGQFDFNQF